MTTLVRNLPLHTLTDAPFGTSVRVRSREVTTLADLPFYILNHFPGTTLVTRALGRRFQEITGSQLFEQVRELSLGLTHLGITPGDRVAIIAESRPEWVIVDLAALAAGAVTVPVYPTQSAHQVEFILRDTGAKAAVVSGLAQLEKIRRVQASLADLELLLVMDGPADGERPYPDALPIAEVSAQGRAVLETDARAPYRFRDAAMERDEHQVATIVYTMDESGDLKGAMLTHSNLLANVRATEEVLPLRADDLALSLLPLSHVFERMALYRYLHDGVRVVFVESLMTVMRDLRRVKPTVMTGVPRVYEKFHSAFEEEVGRASRLRRRIIIWALAIGEKRAALLASGRPVGGFLSAAHRLADRLVLSRIRGGTGGRLRWVICGSAALPERVARFFATIGVPIYEGYGLTETSPVLTTNCPANMRPGGVGKALPGVEIRIAEDGEILARGPNVMVGYLGRPDLNEIALRDGWFHTGDIGTLDEDGYLTITDRKKDLLVTAGGKKVAPAPLEAALMDSPLVADAILIGENRKFISVLIVPDFEALAAHVRDEGLAPGSPDELVQRVDVVQLYQNLVDRLNSGLAQFERIKRLALLPRTVTLARHAGGQTMLKRRQAIERSWQHIVDRVYASGAKD
jgi:long-chain acyl-CoA synthetase